MIEVLKPGLQTTVQDAGRPGFQAYGMPVAGAQDSYSFRIANLLVGNDIGSPFLMNGNRGDAALEILWSGPVLRFDQDAVIALTGALFQPRLNGRPIPQWQSVRVRVGDILDVGVASAGIRGYLAVSGGFDVPVYMGSRSTVIRAQAGGLDGRPLRQGDRLETSTFDAGQRFDIVGMRWATDLIPQWSRHRNLRVVLGPQEDLFTDDSISLFLSTTWTLSTKADRSGFRFAGSRLQFKPRATYLERDAGADPSNIVDDVIPLGGIQVPSGIELIVAGVEGLTTGGYAKIATVITADLGLVGQMRPDQTATFVAVTPDEAATAAHEQSDTLTSGNLRRG